MNEKRIVGASSLNATSVAIGFVLGALVGGGVALLLAPASGKETRRRLAETGRHVGSAARDKLGKVRDVAAELGRDVQSAFDDGREAFEESRTSPEKRAAAPIESTG